jgi:hypothetical protein
MRRGSLFWGFVIILGGVVFLLTNLGIFKGINPWELIWPVFLILMGSWILFGYLIGRNRPVETVQKTIPLEGASRAIVKINHAAGKLTLDDRAGPDQLASGSFDGGLHYEARRDGDTLKVNMEPANPGIFFLDWGWRSGLNWSFGLNRDVPIALKVHTGADESQLDLTDLKVTELELHTGASATTVKMPANAGYTSMKAEIGTASLSVLIPSNVAARIRATGGLASISVDSSRFPKSSGVYQSPDYETAANKVELRVEAGVGSVIIR